jgi:hypothetical protein
MEKAKVKAEKKFNGVRIARQVEKSLKSVFPEDTFYVSSFHDRVEVIYLNSNKCSQAEINMFKIMFCDLAKIKKEELLISLVKKEASTLAK